MHEFIKRAIRERLERLTDAGAGRQFSGEEMQQISGLVRQNGRMVYPSWEMEFDD